MITSYPRTFKDIPKYYAFEGKKFWTILDTGKRVSGELTLRDDNATLQFEVHRGKAGEFDGKRFKKTVGIGDKSTRITLLNSYISESLYSGFLKQGPASFNLKPSLLVFHDGTQKTPDKITNFTGYLPGIGEWFDEDFLEFNYDEYKFKNTKTIYHTIPIWRDIKIVLNSKLTIDYESAIVEGKFLAYPESYIEIEYGNDSTTIDSAINVFNHIENFFNFIFLSPHTTHVFTSDLKLGKSNKTSKAYIIAPNKSKEYRREDKHHGNSMLFKFADISNVNDVFINWVVQYDKIHEIVDTLLLLKSTSISEEMRFTSIINALESVHRRYHDHKNEDDKQYQARIKKIVQQLDKEEDRQLVNSRLQHGNEISLRSRLKEAYAMGELHGIQKPSSQTTNKIIDTRNYYTHGDQAGKKDILTYNELFSVNGLLGRYLKLLLLQVLGIEQTELTEIVSNSAQFKEYYRDEPSKRYPYPL
jgi:hypothetical protein